MTLESSETTSKVSLQLLKKARKKSSVVDATVAESFQQAHTQTNLPNQQAVNSAPLILPALENASKWKRQQQVQANHKEEEDRIAAEALIEEAKQGDVENASRANASIPLHQRENEQYKSDLQALPEAPALESYERVPISDFGAALLRGMGWTGEQSKEEESFQLPRPVRLGLGATPVAPSIAQTVNNGGRPKRPDHFQREALLKQQQESFALERQKQLAMDRQRTMQNGSLVLLESGERARILQLVGVPGLNMVKIQREGENKPSVIKRRSIERLLSRDELDGAPFTEVALSESTRTEVATHVTQRKEINTDLGESNRKSRRKVDEEAEHKLGSKTDRPSKRKKEDRPEWVIPNIRVRVITEKLGRRYFKEKGVVVDVTPKGATIRMQDGKVIDRVSERYIQTALPRTGGNAIILAGRHKLVKGQLLERDSRKETGVVQVYEDMSVVTLSLDDLAEWCGPLDDDLA